MATQYVTNPDGTVTPINVTAIRGVAVDADAKKTAKAAPALPEAPVAAASEPAVENLDDLSE